MKSPPINTVQWVLETNGWEKIEPGQAILVEVSAMKYLNNHLTIVLRPKRGQPDQNPA